MPSDSISEIRALEIKHQTRIEDFSRNIVRLKTEKEKLNNAFSALKDLDLIIPEEISSKLSSYDREIEALKKQMEQEEMLLSYLKSSILTMIEKKPAEEKPSLTRSRLPSRILPVCLIILIFAAIIAGEYVFVYSNPGLGIVIALAIVLAIYIAISIFHFDEPVINSSESLALIPLYVLFTSSLPWFFLDQQFVLPAVYSVILALCIWHIYEKKISLHELGIKSDNLLRYILIGVLIGIPTGYIEYQIINPAPALPYFDFRFFFRDLIYMLAFVGIGEEILFRGLVQRDLSKAFGWKWALLGSALIFSALHLTWRSVPELGFTFFAGLLLGYFYYRTGSLVGPIILHGINNVALVAVFPYLLG